MNNFKKKTFIKFIAVFMMAMIVASSLPLSALAIVYQPGETLNPSCLPTDANCTVTPFLTTNNTSSVNLGPTATTAGSTAELKFQELVANGTNYTGFKSPDALAANILYTLPSADGSSGQVLSTNAAGALSWVTSAPSQWTTSGSNIYYNTGNVGIGTAAPTANLSFNTTTATINNVATNGALTLSSNGTGKIMLNPGTSGLVQIGNSPTQSVVIGGGAFQTITSPQIISLGQILPGAPIIREGLRFLEVAYINGVSTTGNNYVGFQSPGVDLATTTVWSLPVGDGTSGQVLSTDGVGSLSWLSTLTSINGFAQNGNAFGGLATLGTNDNNALALETNGAEHLRILANGNIGIGTNVPAAKLTVSATGTTSPLSVNGEMNVSAFPGWSYRRSVTVNASSALTNYQTSITVDTAALVSAGKMQSDGRDIRIAASDGTTLQNYWIETGTMNTATTRIWFKAASLVSGANTFYLYYGNVSATAASNGDNTFIFFDDFNGSSVDAAKWIADDSTGLSVSGGSLTATNNNAKLRSQWSYAGTPVVQETQFISNSDSVVTSSVMSHGGFWASATDGVSFIRYNNASMTNVSECSFLDAGPFPTNCIGGGTVPSGSEYLSRSSVISGTQVTQEFYNYATNSLIDSLQTITNTVSSGERILLIRDPRDITNGAPLNTSIRFARVRQYTATEPTASVGSEGATPTVLTSTAFLTVNSSGNVLPGANATYDLGSATNKWKDLYLSGTTLYIGDQTLSNQSGSLTWSGTSIAAASSATSTSELKLSELSTNGANYTGFKSPDALAANILYTLPAADGASGQALSTNGSGALAWASVNVGKASTVHHTATTNLAITPTHNNAEIHVENTGGFTIDGTAFTTDTFGAKIISTDATANVTLTPSNFAGAFLRDGTADSGFTTLTIGQDEAYSLTVTNNAGSKYLNVVKLGGGTANAFAQNGNAFGGLATLGTNDNNALALETNGAEHLRILANGNIGIGTNVPAAKLTVSATGTTSPLSVNGEMNVSAFPGWSYRRSVTVNASSALTNYQTSITVDTAALVSAGKMQSDGRDIRIAASDGTTLQNYWIETGTMNTATTRIWFKAASLVSGANTFYLYYGNVSATAASNGDNTFIFFEDFNGSSVDAAKWIADDSTGLSVSGGSLTATNNNAKLRSQWSYAGTPVVQETQGIITTDFTVPHNVTYGSFWASGSDGISFIRYRNAFMPESEDGYFVSENIVPAGNTNSVPLNTEFLSRNSVISGTQVAAQMINYSTGATVNDATYTNTVSIGERILLIRSPNDVAINATGSMSIRFARARQYTATEPTASVGSEGATPTVLTPTTFLTVNSSGNVLPGADSAYNLGSATNRWKDLYLSGATLYLGDQSLSSSGGSLTWSGTSIAAAPSATSTSELKLSELSTNGANYTGFKSPDALAANILYTLPSADATSSGQVLSSNAAGSLSWATVAGATSLAAPTGSNANGGSIASNVLTLSLADGTNPGLVSTGAQTFAGNKTFNGNLSFNGSTATINNVATNGQIRIETNGTGNIVLNPGSGGTVQIGATSGQSLFFGSGGDAATFLADPQLLSFGAISAGGTVNRSVLKFLEPSFIEGVSTSGNNYVGFRVPYAELAATTVWTLPSSDGIAGQTLSTNGSAGLSWATVAGATSLAAPTGSNANGGSIASNVLTLSLADGTNPGLVSTGTQTFAGAKTFSSAPIISPMTSGSVLFAGTSGLVSQNNSNLFWDNTNSRLGIGTTAPVTKFAVAGGDVSVMPAPPSFSATGGTITTSGGYTIHTFTGSGTFTVTGNGTVDILAVAGGGGGGGGTNNAGGAGAGSGGVVYSTSQVVSSGPITVTVGAGGAGGATNTNGANGGNSSFGATSATGGGGGGSNLNNGSNGGSGGGGGFSKAGGAGTAGQGNNGGNGAASTFGGGGGAGGNGGNAGSNGGNGGPGVSNSISGTATIYAGGGAGSYFDFPPSCTGPYNGAGGSGGGGNVCVAGTANTGGGGGSAGVANGTGAAGGSGIVIVRYLTPTSTGGNIGIGTTAPLQLLHVVRSTDGVVARFTDANGDCDINPTSSALICSSDERLKKNIVTIDSTLEKILAFNPVTFNWNKESDGEEKHLGFIAQDVEKLFPSLVSTNENGFKAVAYGNFTPLIIKSIQDQQLEIAGLTGTSSLVFASTTDEILTATDTNPVIDTIAYIKDKIVAGVKIVHELVAERVVAVSGYFKRIFANELCLTDSTGALVCVTGDQLKNIGGQTFITPQTGDSSLPSVFQNDTVTPVIPNVSEESPADSSGDPSSASWRTQDDSGESLQNVGGNEGIATSEPTVAPDSSSQSPQEEQFQELVPVVAVEPVAEELDPAVADEQIATEIETANIVE